MCVGKMRMLRWMTGDEREYTRMVWACDEARENKSSRRVVMKMNVEEKRRIPKQRWLDTIENDMKAENVEN